MRIEIIKKISSFPLMGPNTKYQMELAGFVSTNYELYERTAS